MTLQIITIVLLVAIAHWAKWRVTRVLALLALLALAWANGCARPIDTRPRYVPSCSYPVPSRDTAWTFTETRPCQ